LEAWNNRFTGSTFRIAGLSVTTVGPFLRGDVRNYSFKALAPDGSPIIGLARATSDIYAVDFQLP
jgi:hypothetical protein